MRRVQMLHQHESHARVQREMLKQSGHSLQTACRGANANDGEHHG